MPSHVRYREEPNMIVHGDVKNMSSMLDIGDKSLISSQIEEDTWKSKAVVER